MAWSIGQDVEEFAAVAGAFLRARPVSNTAALTITETLRASGPRAYGEQAPWFAWWREPGGEVTAICLRTPPWPLLIGAASGPAVPALARALAEAGAEVPGVNAADEVARQFAARWQRLAGGTSSVVKRIRLYRLGELVPPQPVPAGQPRLAAPGDKNLLAGWMEAFTAEMGDPEDRDAARRLDDLMSYGGLTVWESGGSPVSFAGRTRVMAGMARVAPVYTPPAQRGRGYAGAVTVAASQAARDAGAAEVLLFTDLANPTSNALYQRIGYRAVEDHLMLAFSAAKAR